MSSAKPNGPQSIDSRLAGSHIQPMAEEQESGRGSSPASRGGAGVYIEGELGAYYLLAMLAGTEARGMPGVKITSVRFQGGRSGLRNG
jgi:hypothetical protein